MASLQTPLTIISNSSGGGSRHQQDFQPPAATWFDEETRSFVALEARQQSLSLPITPRRDGGTPRGSFISGVGSIDSSVLIGSSIGISDDSVANKEDPFEIVKYQAFRLPKKPRSLSIDNEEEEEEEVTIESAFDAAKRNAQEKHKALTIEISVSFPLPLQLATVENRMDESVMSGNSEEDDTIMTGQTQQTIAFSRRIPILAKFSPKMSNGMRFLALQYTPTMIRIATVEKGEDIRKSLPTRRRRQTFAAGERSSSLLSEGDDNDVHFNIDLSYDAFPITSKPEKLPNFREGSQRSIFGPKLEEGIKPGTTSIIGGGVLWSARSSENGVDNAELDLVVVTTTSVIVYSMNMTKKKLIKAHVLPHPLAASFWYEASAKTLVIGSYKSNLRQTSTVEESSGLDVSVTIDRNFSIDDKEEHNRQGDSSIKSVSFPTAVMSMKTIFFSKDSPIVQTLPTFVAGTLREISLDDEEDKHTLQLSLESFGSSKVDNKPHKEKEKSTVVLPTEIFLVKLYDDVYCIELGSLGTDKGGIGLTKLDREANCINVRHQKFDALKGNINEESISVGVMNNLLCIFSKNEETTYYIDVAASFCDDQHVMRDMISLYEPTSNTSGSPHIHDDNLSFLAPHYFLDTNGQGLLFEVSLSLPQLLKGIPTTAMCIPFLLRRSNSKATIRSLIMERFSQLIGLNDIATLRTWLTVLIDEYAECDIATKFDVEGEAHMEEMMKMAKSSQDVSLLTKCSLLQLDDISNADEIVLGSMLVPPEACSRVLTQAEVIQMILLPHVKSVIQMGDSKKLKFMSSFAVSYFVELERRFLAPCASLQCLVIALLYRTGENAELCAFISVQHTQWTITRRRRQLELPTSNRMPFDDPGAVSFAETLFQIATEECHDKASTMCSPSTARQLISHATVTLLGCGATTSAVKCLLSIGQINEAIKLCSAKKNKSEDNTNGVEAKDFFLAAVSNAKQSSLDQNCQSFYLLYYFLQSYEPSVFELESRKVRVSRRGSKNRRSNSFMATAEDLDTMMIEQSVFAHEFPFPNELFGGQDSACARKLRQLFGYSVSVTQRAVM